MVDDSAAKSQKSPETKIHLMQIPHVGKVGNLPGTHIKMSCAATSSSSLSSSSSWIPTAYPSVRILLRKEASSRTLLLDPSFLPYAPPPLVFVSIFSLPGQLTSSVHSLFAANNEPVHNQLRATDAELGEREREISARAADRRVAGGTKFLFNCLSCSGEFLFLVHTSVGD